MTHIDPERIRARNAALARGKLAHCLMLAKECSRNTWQHSPTKAHRREYKRLRRESMNDARYWRDELKRNTED